MELRILLYCGPRDGHVMTLAIALPPEAISVSRANAGLILASPPAASLESYLVYHRIGRRSPEGVEVFSCLPLASKAMMFRPALTTARGSPSPAGVELIRARYWPFARTSQYRPSRPIRATTRPNAVVTPIRVLRLHGVMNARFFHLTLHRVGG